MLLKKEEYSRKRIHYGCSVRIENSVTRDNCSASLGKPRDADPHLTTIILVDFYLDNIKQLRKYH